MAIHGELNEIDLSDIIQTLCFRPERSSLRLKRQAETGTIIIDGGQIIHAAIADLEGIEAAHRLLAWNEGSFYIDHVQDHSPRTIKAHWVGLLLESERLREESRDRIAGRTKRVERKKIKLDPHPQHPIFSFLSRLEKAIEHLGARSLACDQPVAVLEILIDLINQSESSAESLSFLDQSSEDLAETLKIANATYPHLRVLKVEEDRLRIEVAEEEFRILDPGEGRSLYRGLLQGLLEILEARLRQWATLFEDPHLADSWTEMCRIFVHETKTVFESLSLQFGVPAGSRVSLRKYHLSPSKTEIFASL